MNHLYLNNTENVKKFEAIPVRGLNFLLKKLNIYDSFKKHAQDKRKKEGSYSIASLLMVALEMLLFRSPSKNEFYQSKKLGRNFFYKNLGKIAHIEGDNFPHSKTIDDAFLTLNSTDLEPILFDIFKTLCSAKLFLHHPYLNKHQAFCLSIDAVWTHHYTNSSQHPSSACPFCLKRERHLKDGKIKIGYFHIEVIATLIFENGFQLPLYIHRIRNRKEWENLNENDLKQECEQTALPIILAKIRTYLPKTKTKVLLDGLYPNQTSLEALEFFHFGYDIVLKKLKSVQEEIDSIDSEMCFDSSKRFNLIKTACFTNQIPYHNYHLNAIEFKEHAQKKPSKRFAKVQEKNVHYQWIVDEKIDKTNLFPLVEEARSRWQGEDLNNSLKNRGFYFEHDYSRHPFSQTIWKILTLIAFSLTSIFLLSNIGIKASKGTTTHFLMKQMLQDLFYLSHEVIFLCPYPKQLRFSIWSRAC